DSPGINRRGYRATAAIARPDEAAIAQARWRRSGRRRSGRARAFDLGRETTRVSFALALPAKSPGIRRRPPIQHHQARSLGRLPALVRRQTADARFAWVVLAVRRGTYRRQSFGNTQTPPAQVQP